MREVSSNVMLPELPDASMETRKPIASPSRIPAQPDSRIICPTRMPNKIKMNQSLKMNPLRQRKISERIELATNLLLLGRMRGQNVRRTDSAPGRGFFLCDVEFAFGINDGFAQSDGLGLSFLEFQA